MREFAIAPPRLATIIFVRAPFVLVALRRVRRVRACGSAGSALDAPDARPPDRVRRYTIWLGGARVGTAIETVTWSRAGVTLRREEDLRFARGAASVAVHTSIEITADRALVPSRVAWTELGTSARHAEAYRDAAGWHTTSGDALAPGAIPAELVTLYVRRDGRFAGDVFLPARGFVGGAGRVEPVAPGRVVARLALASGARRRGDDRSRRGRHAGARRRRRGRDRAARFAGGGRARRSPRSISSRRRRSRSPVIRAARGSSSTATSRCPPCPASVRCRHPAASSSSSMRRSPARCRPARAAAIARAEIAELVAAVQLRITPDLAATATSAREATAATAGDCTTYALVYAALAAERGIPTRVVTGLRVDGARLVRHRWAVSWTGRAWIAVDAAFGAVPAGGDLVGVAVHDADDAGLVAGEAALTQVRAATWAR